MLKVLNIVLVLLLFQDMLQNFIPVLSYMEEILAIVLPLIALKIYFIDKVKLKINVYEKIAVLLLAIFSFIGLAGNLIYGYANFILGGISMFLTIKAYAIYFSIKYIFEVYKVRIEFIESLYKASLYGIYILFSILIINLPFGFLPTSGKRFGVETVAIGFSHVTELAFFVVIATTIVIFYEAWYSGKIKSYIPIVMASVLIFFTGRTKAIAFFIMFIFVFVISNIFKKLNFRYFIYILPVAFIVALPRIKSEFLDGARGVLYRTGLKIANDHFPVGSGFGTFGSHISRVKYSPLYYNYEINTFWGLGPDKPLFIVDTYWAMILGENGWIGMACMLGIITLIFLPYIKLNLNLNCKIAVLGLIAYSLMSSIAEPIYSSNKSSILFIVLALYFVISKNSKKMIF